VDECEDSMISPMDSVSMAGYRRPAMRGQPNCGNPSRQISSVAPRKRASPTPPLTTDQRIRGLPAIPAHMVTENGQTFSAEVDINDVASIDELIRGLRSAYCHYTSRPIPPDAKFVATLVHVCADL